MQDEVKARVVEALPNELFRVELDNQKQVLGPSGLKTRAKFPAAAAG